MPKDVTYTQKRLLILGAVFLLPILASAQEGKRLLNSQGRMVNIIFALCHKEDSGVCEKHLGIMKEDSFATEERLNNRLVASTQGSYTRAYSRYFEKVFEIPDADFESLSKVEKAKVAQDEQVYIIEIKQNGQTKKFELVNPKKKNVSRHLVNQFKKVESLALAIRKAQNAYERKAIILNNQ